ncbi:MAG: NAD(P)-dependent dehydrogenase (short-subunit alcohol dehydrogenase family) [Bacteroidia bacterium]|jgi:NAD(P)-dependent dehydrogenase (short-subunit alcohol dehydrogenase family)
MIKEFNEWVSKNLDSQKGKTAIVTGANSGIGFYTALGLAKLGATVIVAGRNKERIEEAIQAIEKETITGNVFAGIIDLASLNSVRAFANEFNKNHTKLDLLINNAGVMMPPESKTEEGFELQFGVNFLGHFLLTDLLYRKLVSAQNSRVVTLSSIAHRGSTIDFENLRVEKPYDTKREYYQSKLADLVFALELGRRYESNNDTILSVACHPGFTKTELQRHIDPEILKKMTFMDTWQGSLPTLLAATNKNAKSGDYYGPDGEGEYGGFPALGVIDNSALDLEIAKKLWEVGIQNTKLN